MSVLESFFFLFESDASKLDKGLQDTDKHIDKTVDKVNALDVITGKLGAAFTQTLANLGAAAVALVAVQSLTQAFTESVAAADALDEATARLGLNLEEISAWGDLVNKGGGSTQAFIGSIESLNKQLATLETTGKSKVSPFFEELGINLESVENKGKTALDFLPQIAEAFEGLDKQKSVALGQRLGLDLGTIMTLQAGRREVEALLEKEKELGVITKEQGEIAGNWGDSLDDMRHAMRTVWLSLSEYILPVLTSIAEGFTSVAVLIRKHSDFVIGLMIALGAAIAYYVLPPLASMAAAALVAMAPFLLIAAAVAAISVAFALLYDDIQNFRAGNDSLIGQMLEKWPMLGEIFQGLSDAVVGLGEVFKWTFETMTSLLQIGWELWKRMVAGVLQFTGIGAAVNFIIEGWAGKFKGLGEIVGAVWDWITGKIQAALGVISSAINLVKGVGGAITGALGDAKVSLGITGPTAQGLAAGRAQLGAAAASPLTAQTSSSIMTSSTRGGDRNVNIEKVEVNTAATDSDGISKSIGGALDSQMRQATSGFDDGVAI